MRKTTIVAYIQIVLLLAAVVFGTLLNNDLSSDGLRMAHRGIGTLAGVAGIISLVMIWKISNTPAKVTGILAVIATFLAGFAGNSLSNTENYDQMFGLMRGSGIVALILAIVCVMLIRRSSKLHDERTSEN